MHCRNCRHHLDRESRYCPRCGAPAAVDWPTAGAPWLRRPAAVAGLAVLLVAWLFALQKAIRQPPPRIVQRPAVETKTQQQIARLPAATPVIAEAAERQWKPAPRLETSRAPSVARPEASHPRQEMKPVALRAVAASPRRVASIPQPARLARPRPAVTSRRRIAARVEPRRAPARPGRRVLLASASIEPRRARVRSWRLTTASRPAASRIRPAERTRPRPLLVSARYRPSQAPPPARRSDLMLQVSARPYGSKTFVYYNCGRMLGIAPLTVRFDRPGRHRLFFWTPSTGSRITRWVTVGGQAPQRLTVRTGPPRDIARVQ